MSQNPRVKVTLSEETYSTIQRLSKLNGESMSAILGDLIESVAPSLESTLQLLIAAENASDEGKARLIRALDDIENTLIGAHGASQAQLTHHMRKLSKSDPGRTERSARKKSKKAAAKRLKAS